MPVFFCACVLCGYLYVYAIQTPALDSLELHNIVIFIGQKWSKIKIEEYKKSGILLIVKESQSQKEVVEK